MPDQTPANNDKCDESINFFRPRPGYMRREVVLICVMLLLWGLLTFGFQFLLVLAQQTPAGQGPLTETFILGFPLHYWFTGQFLIVCFIVLCFTFNSIIDRLSRRYRGRDYRRG